MLGTTTVTVTLGVVFVIFVPPFVGFSPVPLVGFLFLPAPGVYVANSVPLDSASSWWCSSSRRSGPRGPGPIPSRPSRSTTVRRGLILEAGELILGRGELRLRLAQLQIRRRRVEVRES